MPPKQKDPWYQDEPDQTIANQPVGFTIPENEQPQLKNALLPYIAEGFTVTPTSGAGYMCGFYALAGSLNAAREFARAPGEAPIKRVTGPEMRGWITAQDPQWVKALQRWREQNPDLGDDVLDELIEAMNRENLAEGLGIQMLLEVANAKLKTNYSLAIICKGHRCKWNEETKAYDLGYILNHVVTDYGTPATGGDETPLLFVWSNNQQSRLKDHRQHKEGIPHYCSLTPWKDSADQDDLAEHQAYTRAWKLDDAAEAHILDGVFIVIMPHSPIEQDNHLKLWKGQFVRPVDPPSGLRVPKGYIYVKKTKDHNRGLVPRNCLRKLSGIKRVEPDPKNDSKKYDFNIFRTISPTNKIGEPYDELILGKQFIGNFQFSDGDFLLASGPDEEEHPLITDIYGDVGRAKMRSLQQLRSPWGDPWGLPRGLPRAKGGDMPKVNMDNKKTVIQTAATARGLTYKNSLTKQSLLDLIAEYDGEKGGKSLPMYRVIGDHPPVAGPPKYPPFLNGEIVLKYRDGDKTASNKRAYVKDYEGKPGRIPDHQLQSIPNAWGLILDAEGLRRILQRISLDVDNAKLGSPTPPKPTTPASKKYQKPPGLPTPPTTGPKTKENTKPPGDDDEKPPAKKTKTTPVTPKIKGKPAPKTSKGKKLSSSTSSDKSTTFAKPDTKFLDELDEKDKKKQSKKKSKK